MLSDTELMDHLKGAASEEVVKSATIKGDNGVSNTTYVGFQKR